MQLHPQLLRPIYALRSPPFLCLHASASSSVTNMQPPILRGVDLDQGRHSTTMVLSARSIEVTTMPFTAAVFVTAVVIAYCVLMGALAWGMWHTRGIRH